MSEVTWPISTVTLSPVDWAAMALVVDPAFTAERQDSAKACVSVTVACQSRFRGLAEGIGCLAMAAVSLASLEHACPAEAAAPLLRADAALPKSVFRVTTSDRPKEVIHLATDPT